MNNQPFKLSPAKPHLKVNWHRMESFTEEQAHEDEYRALCTLVDLFAYNMKRKLRATHDAGRRGWNNPHLKQDIAVALLEHADRGDGQYIDVANLAMMLWNMEAFPNVVFDRDGELITINAKVYFNEQVGRVMTITPEGVEVEFPSYRQVILPENLKVRRTELD